MRNRNLLSLLCGCCCCDRSALLKCDYRLNAERSGHRCTMPAIHLRVISHGTDFWRQSGKQVERWLAR